MSQILTFQVFHKGFPPTQCRKPTNNRFIRYALQNYVIKGMFYVTEFKTYLQLTKIVYMYIVNHHDNFSALPAK